MLDLEAGLSGVLVADFATNAGAVAGDAWKRPMFLNTMSIVACIFLVCSAVSKLKKKGYYNSYYISMFCKKSIFQSRATTC